MFYKLLRPLLFWQCFCFDPRHPGDNPDCPRHGRIARTLRFFVILAAIVLTLIRCTP